MWSWLDVLGKDMGPNSGVWLWLWAVPSEITRQTRSGQAIRATGSVLFACIPHWVMPEGQVFEGYQTIDQGHIAAPRWFESVHATCQDSGAHHFVVYTGEICIIGIFNADFTSVSFSSPQRVDVRQNGFDTGIGADDTKRVPCEKLSVCLVQVVSQVMIDATQSLNAMRPCAGALQFNTAPLVWNEQQPDAPSNKPEEAMRFSQRLQPSQKEIDAARKKGKGEENVITTAVQQMFRTCKFSHSRQALSLPRLVRLLGNVHVRRISNRDCLHRRDRTHRHSQGPLVA
ncbi:hypothetical protein FRB94_006411 [Tulasnella sp. JGI-2019a]|nr:hypothetical protein FRB94_006411 [Tulasnella sp. JGI-2019a]